MLFDLGHRSVRLVSEARKIVIAALLSVRAEVQSQNVHMHNFGIAQRCWAMLKLLMQFLNCCTIWRLHKFTKCAEHILHPLPLAQCQNRRPVSNKETISVRSLYTSILMAPVCIHVCCILLPFMCSCVHTCRCKCPWLCNTLQCVYYSQGGTVAIDFNSETKATTSIQLLTLQYLHGALLAYTILLLYSLLGNGWHWRY